VKPIDVTKLTDRELTNLIDNHRARNATDRPIYLEALEEQTCRRGRGLTFQKSFEAIRRSAVDGEFLSYKDLADASGVDWAKVRYAMPEHLWGLVEYAHRKGWPMLSSIVVNKTNVANGRMEPDTLKGFIGAALALGYPVTDEQAFLEEQQTKVFLWALDGG
jgi:hypothetical protein